MRKRFVTIWFRHLITDWLVLHKPVLVQQPFVVAAPVHGRMLITAANKQAQTQGVDTGMVVTDARAIIPSLQVFDDKPGRADKILKALAEWCIRYTPMAAIDPPDGLILDVTGCAHLWGGERPYLREILTRLKTAGYDVRAAMADTIGTAWGITRYGRVKAIISSGEEAEALGPLPPAALRLSPEILERMRKLGLNQIAAIISMPRAALRRRFGQELLLRMDRALGREEEVMHPLESIPPYQERLPCMEPIVTATGIEIALKRLLEAVCGRLRQEEKGLRTASFKGCRLDGKTEMVTIGTNTASYNIPHLFKLFEPKIADIEPGMGIELFILVAEQVEEVPVRQQELWLASGGVEDAALAELLDCLANRIGVNSICRYLPAEHYWPERSIKRAAALQEKPTAIWQVDRRRPTLLLPNPELIEVAAPVPDYPPMLFRYKNKLHTIKKADGPERIEREWWIEEGTHRDYYCVEDEEGQRYWLFRSGHYTVDKPPQWFVHGFFS